MIYGFTAWPSDSPLGGGGYVDLTGAKNAPAPVEKAPEPLPYQDPNPVLIDWVKRMSDAWTASPKPLDVGCLPKGSVVGVDLARGEDRTAVYWWSPLGPVPSSYAIPRLRAQEWAHMRKRFCGIGGSPQTCEDLWKRANTSSGLTTAEIVARASQMLSVKS